MFKRKIFVLFMIFSCAMSFAQSDLQPLATVKVTSPETITLKQLKVRVDVYEKQAGQKLTPAQRKEVLDGLISEKLLEQAANKAKVVVTDTEVNQYFLESIRQITGQTMTEQEFSKFVKEQTKMSLDDFMRQQTGLSLSEYKASAKSTLTVQRYIATLKQKEFQSASVSDKEIRSYYDINKAQMVQPDYVKIFALEVPKGQNAAAAKTKIAEYQTNLKSKKTTVDELNARFRDNPDIGYRSGLQIIPKSPLSAQQLGVTQEEFLTLFERKLGEVSDVTEFDDRYQIFIVLEREETKMLGLSDLVQPDSTMTVYEYIRGMLQQQKQMQIFTEAMKDISEQYRKPEYFDMKKSGAELDKLLSW